MIIPTAHQAVKKAGMADLGAAAAIGAILSGVASRIPAIASIRETNPVLYDAALAAGTVHLLDVFREQEVGHDQSFVPMRAV